MQQKEDMAVKTEFYISDTGDLYEVWPVHGDWFNYRIKRSKNTTWSERFTNGELKLLEKALSDKLITKATPAAKVLYGFA